MFIETNVTMSTNFITQKVKLSERDHPGKYQ